MEFFKTFWSGLATGTLPSLGYWTYILLAILVAVEGPAATMLGGVMAAAGLLNPFGVFFAAGTGNFTADAGWYMLGRWGHFDYLMERFPRLRKFAPQISYLQSEMRQHATKLLLFTKLSMGVAIIPTLIAAGMARIKWRRLVPVSLLSEVLWTGGLVLSGYYLGNYITELEQGLQILAIVGAILLGLFGLWLYKQLAKQTKLNITNRHPHLSKD
ncbi:MAG: VTT domain-containing protein [Anaerolineales bacterium]|nr:VTT domain-containing protein [Anaerolineales bacterium]